MSLETAGKELYQQPISFKHEALVDLTLSKSPKDDIENGKNSHDKDPIKDFQDKDVFKEVSDVKDLKDFTDQFDKGAKDTVDTFPIT